MQVALDIVVGGDGSLVGVASWPGCAEPMPFHGTLELVALLTSAAGTRVTTAAPVAARDD